MSNIEWTGKTWNPTVGCSLKSPGCTSCYAMKMAHRIQRMSNGKPSHYDGTTKIVNGNPVWTGKINIAPEHLLNATLSVEKPTTWFVDSMSDLFHEDLSNEWRDDVFARIEISERHTYQILTKRSEVMRVYMTDRYGLSGPPKNVWLGVSCEDQDRANERIPNLLATPAAIRFVSAEPLLERIDFTSMSTVQWRKAEIVNALTGELRGMFGDLAGKISSRIDWIISGGESGSDRRNVENVVDHIADIDRQCESAGVAHFVKQDSHFKPGQQGRIPDALWAKKQMPDVKT